MKTDDNGRTWEEGPRVRVRTRAVRREGTGPPPIDPLENALRDAERRFLASQRSSRTAAPSEVLAEYLAVLADLREVDARLQESSVRRDIPYLIDQRLAALSDHCRWLTRRVSAELLLLLQVGLEQKLRRIIGTEAYQIFLRLEEVEEVAREVERLDDGELMARLREGTLIPDILGSVPLPGVPGTAFTVTVPSEPSESE